MRNILIWIAALFIALLLASLSAIAAFELAAAYHLLDVTWRQALLPLLLSCGGLSVACAAWLRQRRASGQGK